MINLPQDIQYKLDFPDLSTNDRLHLLSDIMVCMKECGADVDTGISFDEVDDEYRFTVSISDVRFTCALRNGFYFSIDYKRLLSDDTDRQKLETVCEDLNKSSPIVKLSMRVSPSQRIILVSKAETYIDKSTCLSKMLSVMLHAVLSTWEYAVRELETNIIEY